MMGYANISARDMLDHLFETYGNITAVDLEINFKHMRLLNSRSSNCARTYTQTGQSALRATQVRAALSHAYDVTYQNRITDKS
jgi:hypothetical protein